ncbi:NADP-dependent oxidoreductase [Actinomycetospora endophytica]|uniref:NADP-dependent oxidoreductase n=1 Tax=Actinomycetospora endophytica TaxID=2291215 RepID=A0ABS8PGM9_9PSEU|nr:NADP-dependent oxidoreductase [Actinomycetospora endophytica]MCD2197397.1 NADP-dependent oxidoreductase [Actinomycetospora endophytica]
MQYARYGGPEVLEIVEREDPQPGPGQVRLAVRVASINPIDWKLRGGGMAPSDAPEKPVVPGVDLAGTVEAVGEGVTGLGVGDEVLGNASGGAYAEKALADAKGLVAKPAGVSWEIAGSVAVVVNTAYRVLAQLGLGADDDTAGKVLVINGASGGVGVVATQVAVDRGITVIGTASERHQGDVKALGATPVVYGDGLADRIRAITDHVDAAFDTAGKGSLGDLVALTGSADRVITIADPQAEEYGVQFSSGGGIDGALAEFVGQVAAGRYSAPETVVYSLDEAGKAQEDNRTGAVSGKLVLRM